MALLTCDRSGPEGALPVAFALLEPLQVVMKGLQHVVIQVMDDVLNLSKFIQQNRVN